MYLVPSIIDTLSDQNSLSYVYQNKSGIIVNDLRNSPSFVGGGSPELREMFGKHIAAPIFAADGETVVGVLLVGREKDGEDMNERDLELVQTVIAQIGIALQNRNLIAQIQEEQKTLQSVLDNMPVSVVVVNNRNKILLANSQAQSILGDNIQAGQTFEIRRPIYRTGTETPYPPDELPIRLVQQRGEYYSAEDLAIRLPSGEQIDLVSRAAPIRDEHGNLTSVVGVFQDISELRELERALQESLSETTKLYEASRSVSHATTVESISRAVTQQLSTLHPDHVYITLANPNEDVQLAYAWPPQDAPVTIEDLRLPHSILMPSARMGTTNLTFATRNLHLLPGMGEEELAMLAQQGINGLAVLPLEARGQVFGAIVATFAQERHFSPEERRFLLTLADQTSVAMDAVLSFNNTQQALRSISNLYQASRSIAEVQDVNEAMVVIQEQLQHLQPDRITITVSRDQETPTNLETILDWSADGNEPPPFLVLPSGERLFNLLSQDDYYLENVLSHDSPLATHLDKQPFPYHAIASIPFRATGQPSGRLTLGFTHARTFSGDERQFLRMIADSAAYVIENDMLFRQTQDSLEETGILYQAIRAFANSEDTHGILQAIIDYAADPAVDKALLCQLLTDSWNHPNALMEVVVSWVRGDSVDLTGMRFTAEQFPSWEQISTSEILWVDDVMQDPTLDDTARMGYRALDIASFAIVPLALAGKPIGAILLGSAEPRRHTEREIRVYQSLADQAAITIENLRLYDEAERRARQLATAAQVGQAASSILQIDELLPQMVDLIKNSFGYDQVQIFLVSEDGKNALLKASTGEAGRQLLAIGHYLPVGSYSVIGTVTSTGKPSIALDTADARVVHKPNPYLPNTRSEMAIPLIAKGKILGALDVQSNQPGAFTDADLRVLSILADQMAVAIENASLFELSQQRSEEMSFLFTVANEATTANQLDAMLQRISELLLHQLNATIVIPYLFNEPQQSLHLGAVATVYPLESLDLIETIRLDNDKDPVATVAVQKIPIVIPDMRQNGYHPVRSTSSKSGIYVPLVTGTNFIGVLVLESDQPNQFDDNAVNLLQALTSSLSAVIQSNRLLQDIQEANERLREIDKLKTDFLAAMSHELRTPLNSIIGFSRVILKGIDGPVTEMQQQDLQTIHDSGKHLLGLVNDILDQAKIEAGKMELSREYFDLTEVVKGVMSSAIGLTKEKPIRLYTEVQSDLPKAFGDEFRTRQILFNLVSNAAKFTDEGSITTSVHAVEIDGRRFIQVSVTDTGIGIRQEDFPKLFESFQQVDSSTTRAAEGTGLGLPLAKSLAELQGGQIWVESEYGAGSTFSFTIPVEPLEEPEAEPSAAASDGKNGSSDKPIPRTILVVEDNMDMINFYRRYLSKKGYDVVGVSGLVDAIEKIVSIRPTAVIVNVNMDNNQGWNYLEHLTRLELPQRIPMIVSSLQDEATRSQEMGATFHLTRPFTPDDLLNTIQHLEDRVSS
jgi:GAF domain-containing protein/CheY-like chemotaxis protein